MNARFRWVGFSLVLAIGSAWAATPANDEPLSAMLKQQHELKADLDDGGIEGLTPRQQGIIRKAQQQFFAVTEGKSKLDDLTIEEKVQLENSLEQINAQVVGTRQAGESQEVCWRERTTGSQIEGTRCGTQEEKDEARRGARAFMEKPKICVPPGCGA